MAPPMTLSSRMSANTRSKIICSKLSSRFTLSALVIFLAVSLFPWHALVAAQTSSEKALLLTRADGLAIVDAISDQRQMLRKNHSTRPDCSHLVNAIYHQAGFPYAYAKSADLYRGEPDFVRVSAPQPGDLIVWRGHVGLVTDPRAHLFYSSLRSGLETEDYTSPYWRRKGVPRFYRYRITDDGRYLTAHAGVINRTQESDAYETRQVSQSSGPRVVAVNQTSRQEASPSDDTEEDAMPESPAHGTRSNNAPAGLQPANPSRLNPTLPSNVLLPTGRDKPTVQQVDEAVSRFQEAVVEAIDAEILLHSRAPIVFIKQLHVERVEFKGKKGYALLTIDSDAALNHGALDKSARHEEQRWELTRNKSGWVLTPPAGALYVRQTAAVHLFAQQLAQATESNSTASATRGAIAQQSVLASLLNELLN
jgi:hypothetical protein